jgi:hypothetical protein
MDLLNRCTHLIILTDENCNIHQVQPETNDISKRRKNTITTSKKPRGLPAVWEQLNQNITLNALHVVMTISVADPDPFPSWLGSRSGSISYSHDHNKITGREN